MIRRVNRSKKVCTVTWLSALSLSLFVRYLVSSCVLRDQKTRGDMDDVRRHPRYQIHRKTPRPALLTLARGRCAASRSVQLVSTGCVLLNSTPPPPSTHSIGIVGSPLYFPKLEKWAQAPLLPLPTMSPILSRRNMGEQNTGCAPFLASTSHGY